MLPRETQEIIKSLSVVVERVRGAKAGVEVREELVHFLVSVGLQKDSKKIRFRDLAVADPPLREAFDLLCKLFNFYDNNPYNRDLTPHFQRVEELFSEVARLLDSVLGPHFSSQTERQRLEKIFSVVGTAEFFEDCWANPDLEDELFELYNAMNLYTQFHYHFGDKDD